MGEVNKSQKKDNFGAWVFIMIVIIAMILAVVVFTGSQSIKNIQATMTAIALGTPSH